MEVLRSLLCGRINPLGQVPHTEQYRETAHRLGEAAQKLEQSLTPEQKELLDVYRSASAEEACLVQEYLLEYGVRIGMELQKEVQDTACLLSSE